MLLEYYYWKSFTYLFCFNIHLIIGPIRYYPPPPPGERSSPVRVHKKSNAPPRGRDPAPPRGGILRNINLNYLNVL